MDSELIFVYGTLRKGYWNHRIIYSLFDFKDSLFENKKETDNKKRLKCIPGFVGKGHTVNKYALYADRIPYVKENEPISNIVGELYCVPTEGIHRLDALEKHPDWYIRKKVPIKLNSGGALLAWLYFNPNPKGVLIKTGDFSDYLKPKEDPCIV